MYQKYCKRLIDIVFSGFVILLLSPVFLITILLIKVTMPGPIFFRQERVGLNGKVFYVLKFRSMKVDKELEKNFDISKDEERITGLGRILRRTKIDELPQLLNVFIGDMSLVGPRPTVLKQIKKFNEQQKNRLSVRPGMTGLAQVNGNITLSWDERIKYDLIYIDNITLIKDSKILMKTVLVVLMGESKFTRRF